jgi:hypothetical protein
MDTLTRTIQSHPDARIADAELVPLLQELANCHATCLLCADACLYESAVQDLRRCIALDQHCADACETTIRMSTRIGTVEPDLMREQYDLCATACRTCADECAKHTHHVHCQVCADACRACEQACMQAMDRMVVTAQ